VSCACGTWKPRQGPALIVVIVAGGLTVRDADRPGGQRMTEKRTPAAETQRETATVLISALLLMVAEQPAGYPGNPGRDSGADVVRWAGEERR
jgi:hypothetical protein